MVGEEAYLEWRYQYDRDNFVKELVERERIEKLNELKKRKRKSPLS